MAGGVRQIDRSEPGWRATNVSESEGNRTNQTRFAQTRHSARTERNFSSALACRRETCICETLRRLAISVCEMDS